MTSPSLKWLLTLHCSKKIQFWTIYLSKPLPLMCSEICNKSFKAVFTIPTLCLNCVKMLPAVIRAEPNYIRAGSCVATPSVCLYRSLARFFLLFEVLLSLPLSTNFPCRWKADAQNQLHSLNLYQASQQGWMECWDMHGSRPSKRLQRSTHQ